MELASIEVVPQYMENRYVGMKPSGEINVRLKLQVNGIHEMPPDRSQDGLISWLIGALATVRPEGGVPWISPWVDPKPRVIVVSLRPAIDGAPSMSMSMAPGSTQVLPLDLSVITSKGELAHVAMPIEIRASAH